MNSPSSPALRRFTRPVMSVFAGIAAGLWLAVVPGAWALAITSYNPAVNDRFSSGFSSAPVPTLSGSFLGSGVDFSGVGWGSAVYTVAFGLISPRNYIGAVHYPGDITFKFLGGDGALHTYTEKTRTMTNYGVVFGGDTYGDLSVGTLTAPIPAADRVQAMPVLDMANYTGAPVWMYGNGSNGPRLAATTISSVVTSGSYYSYFKTPTTDSTLEGGDSGSPTFIPWTDPTGVKQLTIIGNNSGVDPSYNWLNFISRPETVTAINNVLVPDGYALRWVADPTATWLGGHGAGGDQAGTPLNWTNGQIPGTASYLAFTSTTTSTFSISLSGSTQSARGLIFSGTTGFTISSGTLSLGRGGMNNFDSRVQTVNAGVTLADHQFWDGHSGGFNVTGNVETAGKLVVIQGSADSTITGAISGSGSLAKDGAGLLSLSGPNSYSGRTTLHNGVLLAANSAGSATGTGPVTVEAGILAGSGAVAGNTTVGAGAHVGGGRVSASGVYVPDPLTQLNNVLSFGGDVTLNGFLDFSLGALDESMGFTELALTGSTAHLTLGNTAGFTLASTNFVGIGGPSSGLSFWNSPHAWTLIDVAGSNPVSGTFGTVSLGSWTQGSFSLATNAGAGGNNVQLSYQPNPTPEPGSVSLFVLGIGLAGALRRGRSRAE